MIYKSNDEDDQKHMLLVLIVFSLPAQITPSSRRSMKEKIAEIVVSKLSEDKLMQPTS